MLTISALLLLTVREALFVFSDNAYKIKQNGLPS